jgi:AAA domain (dynein-related subfamily)
VPAHRQLSTKKVTGEVKHMLETILRLYVMYMATDCRSPVPHLFGPPGCGKSTVVQELADLVGVNLHTINVSRISPLELEGVQMPVEENTRLLLLHATFWTQINEGDIVLFDEFLRGFPEVYNGLLDIFTARKVGGYVIPKAFFIAASNTTVSYDKALEDRLLHLPVPDPRKRKAEKKHLAKILVDVLGLMPQMVDSMEMQTMLDTEVMPMYEVLDSLKNKSSSPATVQGQSIRNLIGQAQLRQVQSAALKELISMNNLQAMKAGKVQYVFLLDGKVKNIDQTYESKAKQLVGNSRLTEVQSLNLNLNLQLIEMESARREKGVDDDDVIDDPGPEIF